MDITAIRAGINTNINTVAGLNTYPAVVDKPEPPGALVVPNRDPFIERLTMGRNAKMALRFKVLVVIGTADMPSAQTSLDAYLAMSGPTSLWAAIESDRTLGGAAEDCAVESVGSYGEISWNELRYVGAELLVAVTARG